MQIAIRAAKRGAHVFTRDNVVAGVEQSLARMKTDYLDVVQFHASPSRQTLEGRGVLDALLVGKINQGSPTAAVQPTASSVALLMFQSAPVLNPGVDR